MANAEYSVMLSRVSSGLASISGHESQPRLWSANTTQKAADDKFSGDDVVPDSLNHWVFQRNSNSTSKTDPVPDFFVAGVPAGTTTGVLRQHLMRLSSSIQCQEVDPSEFPSQCPGDQPFTVSWDVLDTKVRMCVPGDYTAFPWDLSRGRQEHIEEIHIDVNDTSIADDFDSTNLMWDTSYSIRCTATTIRGYFEMGNNWNHNTYGPLLERWPDTAQMAEDFNDWTDTSRWGPSWEAVKPYVPSDIDTSFGGRTSTPQYEIGYDFEGWGIPGPLMTSALALFGNGSWLSTAADYRSENEYGNDNLWQLFCRGMPFLELGMVLDHSLAGDTNFASDCKTADESLVDGHWGIGGDDLSYATQHLLAAFAPASKDRTLNNPDNLLTTAMFVANQAFLTLASPEFGPANAPPAGRLIYASPGTAVQKPFLSKTAVVVLSILIGLQLLGLGYLTYYLYRIPSWTHQLDAMAIARIGASLHGRGVLPAIGSVSKDNIAALQTVGGLIGIVEKPPRRDSSTTTFVFPALATTSSVEAESQWLNPTEQGRESLQTRSTSPKVDDTDGSSLEIQRLSPVEEGSASFQDRISAAVSPNPDTANNSDPEMQRLNSTEELRGSFEEVSTGVELGIDAPGPILAADVLRRRSHVSGLKRAWKGTFEWR
ncbi:uncharacterized protein J4E79_010615 [Alternaria viburni]|uniref:uncharacterized protein n=1 Tax=Alternaria viburni TaxID=566460 RepID=UPI0020C3EE6D|nr:uncharacterized protein J4E79_010615 [Alternaria viburni]KAI4646106.1 hypothetical protein J4E79_010615 [Alternaria viburni]